MIRFFSASNGIVNSKKAMEAALEEALATESDLDCQVVMFHATVGHQFSDLLATARAMCPGAHLIGCSSAGVIGKEGANESLFALAIMVMKTDNPQELAVSVAPKIDGRSAYEVARQMALDVQAQQPETNMVQLLATGIDIAADQAIAGIESVFGPKVPIFGGTSSDNMRAERSYQFTTDQALQNGALLLGFADPELRLHSGVHHGFSPIGMGYTVTKVEANRIFEIEGQPAWSFLMEKLNLPKDTMPGPCIPICGMGELLPPDLQLAYDNTHILRVITKVDWDDYSIYYPVSCEVGTKLWFSERNEELIFEGLDRMVARLAGEIGEEQLVAVFHTDCAARGRFLFNKILKDEIIHRMQYPLVGQRDIPWIGMYGFGEFTMLRGQNLYHNYTSSVYALSRPQNKQSGADQIS
jgi:hypothetical protein